MSNLETQNKFVNNLPDEIKKSLTWYTGGGFDKFNENMRKETKLSPIQKNNLQKIDTAFLGVQALTNAITVFKGTNSSNVYSDKSFISTSRDYKIAQDNFGGTNSVIWRITVSPGSKVLPLESISKYVEENEILLDRNGILVVTGTHITKHQQKIIYVTYNPPNTLVVKNITDIKKAEKQMDPDLIIQRIVDFFADEDPDFVDDHSIKILYKNLLKKDISFEELETIKLRLNIQ